MNPTVEKCLEAFEKELVEYDFISYYIKNHTYTICPKTKPDRIIAVKLIVTEPVNERMYGTKSNTPITAIGYFRFKFLLEEHAPDFYIFTFDNLSKDKIEFVIVPIRELKDRLNHRTNITAENEEKELLLWLLPDGYVFEATNFGAEGEWWFLAGRMAESTIWDYTSFLNRWDKLVYQD